MEQEKMDNLWENITNELKNYLSEKAIENWFSPLKVRVVSLEDNTLTLSVQNNIIKDYIETLYNGSYGCL